MYGKNDNNLWSEKQITYINSKKKHLKKYNYNFGRGLALCTLELLTATHAYAYTTSQPKQLQTFSKQ